VLERVHCALGKVGEMVDRFLVHQPSFRAAPVRRNNTPLPVSQAGGGKGSAAWSIARQAD
jgi:hypothetical protein